MKPARVGAAMFLIAVVAMLVVAAARAQENEGIFRDAQEGGYFESKDDEQDWLIFWVSRELDHLFEEIRTNEAARVADDRELRSYIWKLALLIGGGGAAGGAGARLALKRRRNRQNGE